LVFKKFEFKAKTFNPSTVIKTDVKTMHVIKGAFDNFRNVPPATMLWADWAVWDGSGEWGHASLL